MTKIVVCCAFLALTSGADAAQPPENLPRYKLELSLDTHLHRADLNLEIQWTNLSSTRSTNELVVNFWPLYRIPDGDHLHLAKTLELLRLHPSYGIDRQGRHGVINRVNYLGKNSQRTEERLLQYHYRHDMPTSIVIELPEIVEPGQSITIGMSASIRLPNKQGRWGHWQNVHFLANAIPVVAFYDDQGWHHVPFVPWHQPFWNEAGHYLASITLPENEKLACSAAIESEQVLGNGWKKIQTKPFLGRDFALVCSADFEEYSTVLALPDGRQVPLKCLAFPRHEHYAREMLRFVSEAIPTFCEWLGPFPHEQFTVVESFFGWNGNETAGMVLIDERVFNMPHLSKGYVEYLVSHETCHQWWYNLVGTNGYAETFIDEGAATYFTHRLIDRKHGKNNKFLEWPKQFEWLPNIQRENYRFASMYGSIRRNEMPAAAGELPGFNHLIGLFSGAYDRGSKAFGMIEDRLGEAAFLDFTRGLVAKYSWKVLSAAQLREELEAYTGNDCSEFFERWIYGKGLVDWSVDRVDVQAPSRGTQSFVSSERIVRIQVKQTAEYEESTTVGISLAEGDGYPIRVPIGPGSPTAPGEWPSVERLGPGHYEVSIRTQGEPANIKVDPDNILLDKDLGNNSWKNTPRVQFSPLHTMLNETDLTNDIDRWNFGGGPWIGGALYPDPWYTRSTMVGLRASAYRTQTFQGGLYSAYRNDYRDLVLGADGLWDHWPHPRTQLGFNYEQRIAGPFGDLRGESTAKRGSLFARYVHQYSSSLYLPPLAYSEVFTTYQDNFLPIARESNRGARRPEWTWLNGVHTRVNLYTPYWDPECGFWFDAMAASGVTSLRRDDVAVHQLRGELAAVRKIPGNLGPLTDTRVAGRVVAHGAFPDRGQFFALGGGTLFRGFDMGQRQGSFLWVANSELRLPVLHHITWDTLDHLVGARNVWLALFYDVGAVYSDGRVVGDVAHALGAGIRVDTALFSFMERLTLRFDVAKTINANTPVQFWFGIQHAF